jgi:hypothetical protein
MGWQPPGRGLLAVDAEAAVTPDGPPVAFDDGNGEVLVRPERLGEFLRAHAGRELLCRDAASTHWRLLGLLGEAGDDGAKGILWDYSACGRLHGAALLGELVALAGAGAGRLRLGAGAAAGAGATVPGVSPPSSVVLRGPDLAAARALSLPALYAVLFVLALLGYRQWAMSLRGPQPA